MIQAGSAELSGGRQRLDWQQDESGAYSVGLGPVEIIGLNAAGHWRKFLFPEGRQLRFLEERLQKEEAERGRDWRMILCHAPLLAHNPQRKPGGTPYLNRDRELQRIVDGQEEVIFISGHTHFLPNVPEGCVEYEPEARRLYLNAGSVRPAEMGTGRPRAAAGDIIVFREKARRPACPSADKNAVLDGKTEGKSPQAFEHGMLSAG